MKVCGVSGWGSVIIVRLPVVVVLGRDRRMVARIRRAPPARSPTVDEHRPGFQASWAMRRLSSTDTVTIVAEEIFCIVSEEIFCIASYVVVTTLGTATSTT